MVYSLPMKIFVSVIVLIILTSNLSCKSAAQKEAEEQAAQWFGRSFRQCGSSMVTTTFPDLHVGPRWFDNFSGITEFKSVGYRLTEETPTEVEKLNGIEYRGVLELTPTPPTLRTYDESTKKWSEWKSGLITFTTSPDPLSQAIDKSLNDPNRVTPWVRQIVKKNGNWTGFPHNFTATDCPPGV